MWFHVQNVMALRTHLAHTFFAKIRLGTLLKLELGWSLSENQPIIDSFDLLVV